MFWRDGYAERGRSGGFIKVYLLSKGCETPEPELNTVLIPNFGAGLLPDEIDWHLNRYDGLESTGVCRISLTTSHPHAITTAQHHAVEVFVWQDGEWKHIVDCFNPAWLAHFSLGDLYVQGELC